MGSKRRAEIRKPTRDFAQEPDLLVGTRQQFVHTRAKRVGAYLDAPVFAGKRISAVLLLPLASGSMQNLGSDPPEWLQVLIDNIIVVEELYVVRDRIIPPRV